MGKEQIIAALGKIEFWREISAAIVALALGAEVILGFRYSAKNKQLLAIQKQEEQQLNLQIEELRTENLILAKPRWQSFDNNRFVDTLKGRPKANIAILFWPNDIGSAEMATTLWTSFVRVGWPIIELRPLNTNEIRGDGNVNIMQGETGSTLGEREIKIVFNKVFFPEGMQDINTPIGSVLHALGEGQIIAGKPRRLFINGWWPDSDVSTNTLKLLIGQGF
jgi:hypothetical protein